MRPNGLSDVLFYNSKIETDWELNVKSAWQMNGEVQVKKSLVRLKIGRKTNNWSHRSEGSL